MQETNHPFRTELGETIFKQKYAIKPEETWQELAERVVEDVCGTRWGTATALLSKTDREALVSLIAQMKFIPGGRYLYYAGRPFKAFNNCYLLRAEEDTREEWSRLKYRSSSCLMTGGGIGIDYSLLRPFGSKLSRTGGMASGPIPLMESINEIGRNVKQGGSRRSAIYASLNWSHSDVHNFLVVKNWKDKKIAGAYHQDGREFTVADAKQADFNYPAALDMTNISLNYDDTWLNKADRESDPTFLKNVEQALSTGEPGFSFNFGDKQNETLRNACTEVVSEDDSDVCNLGSLNLGNISTLEEFRSAVYLASAFLVCGTLRADLPYEKVYRVREKNRRLGLGLMGIHEWLLKRGMRYEVTPELRSWLAVYRDVSVASANSVCDSLSLSKPVAYRAIAPTGTIGILAGTTTGIEPLFAVAYKRRYLHGNKWKYKYVVDATAGAIFENSGRDNALYDNSATVPLDDDCAYNMANSDSGIRRRIQFQADCQDYVDQSISSTLNTRGWNWDEDNRDYVKRVAGILSEYAPRLRGFTVYPDGARGGQPLTVVPYEEAIKHKGLTYEENSEEACKSGVCGI